MRFLHAFGFIIRELFAICKLDAIILNSCNLAALL